MLKTEQVGASYDPPASFAGSDSPSTPNLATAPARLYVVRLGAVRQYPYEVSFRDRITGHRCLRKTYQIGSSIHTGPCLARQAATPLSGTHLRYPLRRR